MGNSNKCPGRRMRAPGARVFQQLSSELNLARIKLNDRTPAASEPVHSGDLRAALRAGPLNAAQLGAATGVASKRVGGLLSHDVAAGRVIRRVDTHSARRAMLYALAPSEGGRP